MVKCAFGFPVVAMVSHIPVKSRIAGNDVTCGLIFKVVSLLFVDIIKWRFDILVVVMSERDPSPDRFPHK